VGWRQSFDMMGVHFMGKKAICLILDASDQKYDVIFFHEGNIVLYQTIVKIFVVEMLSRQILVNFGTVLLTLAFNMLQLRGSLLRCYLQVCTRLETLQGPGLCFGIAQASPFLLIVDSARSFSLPLISRRFHVRSDIRDPFSFVIKEQNRSGDRRPGDLMDDAD
jgi:hypothetical protein